MFRRPCLKIIQQNHTIHVRLCLRLRHSLIILHNDYLYGFVRYMCPLICTILSFSAAYSVPFTFSAVSVTFFCTCYSACNFHPYLYRAFIVKRRNLHPVNIFFLHALQPHSLPDSALRCVEKRTENTLFRKLLLSSRVRTLLRPIRDMHRQNIFLRKRLCHIERKRQITSLMRAKPLTV